MNKSHAFESDYQYGLGTLYTDNSLLTEKNKKDELSIVALAGFNIFDVRPTIRYSLNANVIHTKYTKNTLSDTTYYALIADLNWEIIPTTFLWQVNNNLSVQEINRFSRPLPNNKRQVNIFFTGPSFVYRLNPINNILLDYRFYDIKYEKRNLLVNTDNQRDIYKIAFEHKVSESSNISLNYKDITVRYADTSVNNDYVGDSTYLSYDTVKARSALNLSYGINKAKLLTNAREIEGNFYTALWNYQINFSSNLSASYWNGLSDPTNDINLANILNSGAVPTNDLNNSDLFFVERFNILYVKNKSNWQTSYSVFGIEQDYGQIRPTQRTVGGNILFDYNITRTLVLTSSLTQINRKTLSSIERNSVDNSFSLGTRYYISNNLQFITQYRMNKRNSSQIGRSYDENAIFISLIFNNAQPVMVGNAPVRFNRLQ
ncbi:MAG: outer membrane beta-barrel protein [Thiohalomonadales bacterium]